MATGNCLNCKKEIRIFKSRPAKYCSHSCAMKRNKFAIGHEPWNKGKNNGWINTNGYRQVMFKGKEILEHHYIWCINNGFYYIPKNCVVHHINGNKIDNRPENLSLLPRNLHTKLHKKLWGGD